MSYLLYIVHPTFLAYLQQQPQPQQVNRGKVSFDNMKTCMLAEGLPHKSVNMSVFEAAVRIIEPNDHHTTTTTNYKRVE